MTHSASKPTDCRQQNLKPLSYDAIDEYNISTANYDVTNKRAVGAAINIVTKSGTNDFHGSVYYYAYTNAVDDLTGNGVNDTDFNGFQRTSGQRAARSVGRSSRTRCCSSLSITKNP